MSREMEAQDVSDDLKVQGRQNNMSETKREKRWVLPVAVVTGALLASVIFGVGFAIAYYTYAVPNAGEYPGVYATLYIAFREGLVLLIFGVIDLLDYNVRALEITRGPVAVPLCLVTCKTGKNRFKCLPGMNLLSK